VSALFLAGENEKLYSARRAVERLSRVAPRVQTEIVPRAGHDLIAVKAEMVNRKVLEFLGQP
jgi:pimeloyl-ACP methyl ester carboxylesterase